MRGAAFGRNVRRMDIHATAEFMRFMADALPWLALGGLAVLVFTLTRLR